MDSIPEDPVRWKNAPIPEPATLSQDGKLFPDAFYVRVGEHRFASTLHSQGAWQPGEQHLAVASGLMLAEVERRLPSDKLVSGASFDILGVIHSGEFTVDVNVVRAGRTIELIEANAATASKSVSAHASGDSLPRTPRRYRVSRVADLAAARFPTCLEFLVALEWWFHQRARGAPGSGGLPAGEAQLAAYALSRHLGRGRAPPSRAF